MDKDKKGKVEQYDSAAGGWGALEAVATHMIEEKVPLSNYKMVFRQNQPKGFDCPGCAWPDREHTSTFEFCENGIKAVAAESTGKRVTREFFAQNTVAQLMQESDYELEEHGRLTSPMVYDEVTDKYQPISWDDAFKLIAKHLNQLANPNMATFYTSGRASNEAAFLYQLFVRNYGTNNFPDCSNMCHEATSRGLPITLGVGKGTVNFDDFENADTFLLFGHNPATNHPRMLVELRESSKRGATLVSINTLRERGLERFTSPQSPLEMLTLSSTNLCSVFVQPKIGGDFALIKAMAKGVLELDDAAIKTHTERILDVEFISSHTEGFENFANDLRNADLDELVEMSGVPYEQIEALTKIYVKGKAVIATWGMGLTQNKHAVATIQMLSNLMMMRGNIGRRGAGLCPLRGHSNVQGNRTVGIEEQPTSAFLDRLKLVFNFEPPREHGLDVVRSIHAMLKGQVKVFFGLGGNFAMATPDTPRTWDALRSCDLTVHVTTKLNRSHLVHGKDALILPTIGRTEIDTQASGEQAVTVEDSFSSVHASFGINKPASEELRSEVAIVAGMANAVLGGKKINWLWYADDYSRIRDVMEQVFDDFYDFNKRIERPGGFYLRNTARNRIWETKNGKAQFLVNKIEQDTPIIRAKAIHGEQLMLLMTLRSHDQYNTTIYGMDDRYRSVFGQRQVLFANAKDIDRLGYKSGELVDIECIWDDDIKRRVEKFVLVEHDIPLGCLGAYYPETNVLVPLESTADIVGTPTSKLIPVILTRSAANME